MTIHKAGLCNFLHEQVSLLDDVSRQLSRNKLPSQVCGLHGTVVSVVTFRVKGHGLKSTHGCSHTVQKPWLFGQCTLNIYLPLTKPSEIPTPKVLSVGHQLTRPVRPFTTHEDCNTIYQYMHHVSTSKKIFFPAVPCYCIDLRMHIFCSKLLI